MKRRQDWPERLHEYLDTLRRAEFVWGTTDCSLMAADAVLWMTDDDPAWWFRGQYDDASGAVRYLKKFAGGGLLETVRKLAATYGWEEVHPNWAQRGDPVLVENLDARWPQALGICLGHLVAVMTDKGLGAVPMGRATLAWRV